jgi:hypothetical protein
MWHKSDTWEAEHGLTIVLSAILDSWPKSLEISKRLVQAPSSLWRLA